MATSSSSSSSSVLMSSNSPDYATLFGFHSVAAAAIFAVLFIIVGAWYIRQSLRNTTTVYITLTLFCAMRVSAYIIRAILSNSVSEGSNLDIFIADQVLFGIGFFALLYSAFNLVLDRNVLAGGAGSTFQSLNILRNPHLFRLLLTVGVALSIVGTVDITSSNNSTVSTGQSLHKAGTIIFLVLTIVQSAQILYFFFFSDTPAKRVSSSPHWGALHALPLIILINLMMLIREIFLAATINSARAQGNEHLWYPLVALPEFFAVICFSVSGLVPTRREVRDAKEMGQGQGQEGWALGP